MDGRPKVQSIAPLARPMEVVVIHRELVERGRGHFDGHNELHRVPIVGLATTEHGVSYLVHDSRQRCPVPLDEWEEESLPYSCAIADVVEQGAEPHPPPLNEARELLAYRIQSYSIAA